VKLPVSVLRFLFEAAFIVLIAAATAVAHLGKVWIALSVGGAWLLVSVVERSALQEGSLLSNGHLRVFFAGRRQASAAESATDERPPEPVPEPEPTPEPAPPAPEPQPPTPEPGDPPPQLRSVPPPEPEALVELDGEPELMEPQPVVRLPVEHAEPRAWNIWELERLAGEAEGRDPAHDEELVFLLLELRQFANADGQLPVQFDPVVRESFGELLYAAV
jgi:hypothetical protein